MGNHVVDIKRGLEKLGALACLFLAALAFLGLGHDVDFPAGELGGELHVLAAPPDRKAELIVGHDDLGLVLLLVHQHLADLGGSQRIDDEVRGVGRPRDDVDLLALQLLHHRLDAAAAHADAGADRVDRAVVGEHGDLGAAARVASDGLDLDDVVVDLRHFLGEQLGHELRMAARQEDLRAARLLADVEDVGAHPVVDAQALARNRLVAADHAFGALQVDGDVAVVDPLDHAGHDLADPVLEFLVLALALALAHALGDHLLGGLRGNAAEIDRRQLIGQEVADLRLGIAALGLGDRDLGVLVLDRVGDLHVAQQLDLAGLAVDLGADVVLQPVLGAAGLLDGLLHRLEHLLALDALLAGDHVGHLQHLQTRDIGSRCHDCLPLVSYSISAIAPPPRGRGGVHQVTRQSIRAWPWSRPTTAAGLPCRLRAAAARCRLRPRAACP